MALVARSYCSAAAGTSVGIQAVTPRRARNSETRRKSSGLAAMVSTPTAP